MGVSGKTGASSRDGWQTLWNRLEEGNTLVVVSIDRIGRRRLDVMGSIRDLRERGGKIRSLNQSEASWAQYLDADPHTPEAFLADILASFAAWNAEQELEAIRRRTVAGMARARAQGKLPGPPNKLRDDQVAIATERRRQGWSLRRIGKSLGVSGTTVSRYLEQARGGGPMIIHVVQEKDLPNFGYVEEGKDIPRGFHPWADLDMCDWSLTFPDGPLFGTAASRSSTRTWERSC